MEVFDLSTYKKFPIKRNYVHAQEKLHCGTLIEPFTLGPQKPIRLVINKDSTRDIFSRAL